MLKFRSSQCTVLAILSSCLLFVVLFCSAKQAIAQDTAGIRGTITDSAGKVVVGSSLTITNEATGFTQSAVSGNSGVYTFTLLPIGSYTLTADAPGFRRYQHT